MECKITEIHVFLEGTKKLIIKTLLKKENVKNNDDHDFLSHSPETLTTIMFLGM